MKRLISLSCLALCLCSCVPNRLPDPVFVATIRSITAVGTTETKIDNNERSVNFTMDETYDLSKVNVTACSFNNNDIVKPSEPVVGVHDLRSPKSIILSTYQDYEWKLKATQPIARGFLVDGQTGESVIDVENHRVMLKVTKATPRTNLTVKYCKLGPRDITTYSPDPLSLKDFSQPVTIGVSYRDQSEQWVVVVENSLVDVEITRVSAWENCCYLEANAPQDADNGFVFRRVGETKWTKVDTSSTLAGKMLGVATGLSQETQYECRAFSNTDTTEVWPFTTGKAVQLPNAGLDESYDVGKYCEFYNPSSKDPACTTPWWGSGNGCSSKKIAGSADMGFVICEPDTQLKTQGKQSACLQSAWAIVKFAAGNLFCGEFAGLVGTRGGMVNFGRPFVAHPRAISVMVMYENGPIDHVDGYPSGTTVKEGDPDKCQIYVALGNWDAKTYGGTDDCPVQVNTTNTDTFFKPDGPNVIAYGSFMSDQKISQWTKVVIPLSYRDDFTAPTHIIISCAASYLGDYFTGYSGSKLWIDDFEVIY